jgi:hypothetical protein
MLLCRLYVQALVPSISVQNLAEYELVSKSTCGTLSDDYVCLFGNDLHQLPEACSLSFRPESPELCSADLSTKLKRCYDSFCCATVAASGSLSSRCVDCVSSIVLRQ